MSNTTSNTQHPAHPQVSSYREVKMGRTLYRVTSVYTGEKKLGPALERLAAQQVLTEMDKRAKNILQNS
ncbi:hypothetical protein LJC60_01990 [Ruminococcaceae bacterium OttesenSCG-928-D13]|nr:hypothetical protein [Ruminococcaceae bacterium OttesenSCG-928-D13]